MNEISLRRMTEAEVPAADELRRLVGWNQTLADWRRLLQLEPHGCFLAMQAGKVVGSVTTTTYGQALAWIGMMLVHPEHRRQGIGMSLMLQAMEYLQGGRALCDRAAALPMTIPSDPGLPRQQGIKCIRLDATPAGFPLYEKLGFVSEWTLTRWQRPTDSEIVVSTSALAETRGLQETDWRSVEEMDTAAFGTSRAPLLRSLAQQSLAALVWPAQGPIAGWGLLRPGTNADYLGPLVCANAEGSLALVTALLQRAGKRSVFWDVPDANEVALPLAQQFHFTRVRPLTRMRLGPNSVKSAPQAQLAIADPAVG